MGVVGTLTLDIPAPFLVVIFQFHLIKDGIFSSIYFSFFLQPHLFGTRCYRLGKAERLQMETPVFTAHNIILDNGTRTKPEADTTMSAHPWFLAARRLLKTLYPAQGLVGQSIIDLACLEGGYTVEFARMGMNALGVEVREANYQKCRYVKDNVSLPNLRFVKDDVWNLEHYGHFDIIFCCGILYHLDRPREFIRLMGRCCNKAVIINTHFAPETPTESFKLSDIDSNEGLSGRWYLEHDGTAEQRDNALWSSWENRKSFWLRRPDLLYALKEAGFNLIFEQFDSLAGDIRESMANGEYGSSVRSTFVAVK